MGIAGNMRAYAADCTLTTQSQPKEGETLVSLWPKRRCSSTSTPIAPSAVTLSLSCVWAVSDGLMIVAELPWV